MVNIRHASWGHWSITFWQRSAHATSTYLPGVKVAEIFFPVGSRGPMDGPNRENYRRAVKAWVDAGIIPSYLASLNTP